MVPRLFRFPLTLPLTLVFILAFASNTKGFAQEEKKTAEPPAEAAELAESAPNQDKNNSGDTANPSSGKTVFSRSEIKIAVPINHLSQTKQDLTHYIPADELNPMLAGPDDFLTLLSPNLSANERGVAIILPEWQQSATNPKAVNYLRKKLPIKGWTTITIQPKEMPVGYPSKLENKGERLDENSKSLEEYQNTLAKIMNSVNERSKDYPGLIMVIAQGQNAVQLHTLYALDKIEKPNALILLSAYMATEAEQIQFAEQLSQTNLATLDLVLSNDHPLALANANYRNKLSKKEMKVTYRQRTLQNRRTGYYPQEQLYRQIHGWLAAIGW